MAQLVPNHCRTFSEELEDAAAAWSPTSDASFTLGEFSSAMSPLSTCDGIDIPTERQRHVSESSTTLCRKLRGGLKKSPGRPRMKLDGLPEEVCTLHLHTDFARRGAAM